MLPDLRIGGGQTLLLENIRTLDPARFRHTVCYVRPREEMAERFRAAGAEIVDFGLRSRRSEPAAVLRLLRTARDRRIDLVHSNNTPEDLRLGVLVSRLGRLPLAITLHGFRGTPSRLRRRLYKAALWRLARRHLSGVIAVSDPVRDAWIPHFHTLGLPDDWLTTVTPALDLARFRFPPDSGTRERVRATLGLAPDTGLLLNVGRLVPRKGHALLLDLVERLRRDGRPVALALAGDGPLRPEIEAEVARRGLDVRLLGNVEDVPALLAAADVFVFPSETESFGIAPLEAMAAGVPVVAAELPALASFIDTDRNGLIVPQGDLDGFAVQVEALLANRGLAACLARAARDVVEARYSTEISARRMAEFYAATVRRAGSRPRR
jgi:glycosyltransferase involved in cell wall biosynthesis